MVRFLPANQASPPLLFQDLFNIHKRVFSPGSPARPRPSALFPSADISYIVWDTVDARKNPAASVELKVQSGGGVCRLNGPRLGVS